MFEPTLNGERLELDQYETSRSLAISPDGASVLLGTEWSLRLYDRNGEMQWQMPVPEVAWSVNIPQKGNVAVAAIGDGTIRWYRLKDGQELLVLFPHPDGQRWIVWTPEGYYDAAAGAEDLLGWHVNQGPDKEALFYPVSQFRKIYYRPDVIAQVLDTLDVQVSLLRANKARQEQSTSMKIAKALPPVVTLLAPADGTSVSDRNVKIQYILNSPTGDPITHLKALVDGRPRLTLSEPPLQTDEEEFPYLSLFIPKRDTTIALLAENKHGPSQAATAKLYWSEKRPDPTKPKLWLLAIGVSAYPIRSSNSSLPRRMHRIFQLHLNYRLVRSSGMWRPRSSRIAKPRGKRFWMGLVG